MRLLKGKRLESWRILKGQFSLQRVHRINRAHGTGCFAEGKAEQEGLLGERRPDAGTIRRLEAFMKKYGYRDGRGWWVENHDPE